MNRFVALVCLAAGLASAEIQQGNCPSFSNIGSFDINQYAGIWYENERIPSRYEGSLDCVVADYGVMNSTLMVFLKEGSRNNFPIGISGPAYVLSKPGEFYFDFGQSGTHPNYNVLATDYTKYASVYSCYQDGSSFEQYGWVLSRERTLDDTTVAAAKKVFTDNGIDISNMAIVQQGSSCTYKH